MTVCERFTHDTRLSAISKSEYAMCVWWWGGECESASRTVIIVAIVCEILGIGVLLAAQCVPRERASRMRGAHEAVESTWRSTRVHIQMLKSYAMLRQRDWLSPSSLARNCFRVLF